MTRLNEVRLELDDEPASRGGVVQTEGPLLRACARKLGVPQQRVLSAEVMRRNIDARKKSDVHFSVNAEVVLAGETPACKTPPADSLFCPVEPSDVPEHVRPVVVGTGPAGLFCALALARAGLHPVVLERGAAVEERTRAVQEFASGGPLNVQTNIQFGEGGAGTFSDGKLTTGTKGKFARTVLDWFVRAGAPSDILWDAHPHIGSDLLPGVVRTMREEIIARGGDVLFNTQLVGLEFEAGHVVAVCAKTATREITLPATQVVLAPGHSARDTFEMLLDAGIHLEQKPFAMGVRIEHEQAAINRVQWGAAATHAALAGRAADYKMAVHLGAGRSAFTFCMCPGGVVVAAASEEGGVCVNGMSEYARAGKNANAALLVNVDPTDFPGADPLAGCRLQQQVERAAYEVAIKAGGAPYAAPAQTVGSFLEGSTPRADGSVQATYPRGVVACDLRQVLPAFVCDTLAEALPLLDRKLPGFATPGALLTAPEARSSSPVRMCRGADLQAFLQPAFAAAEAAGGAGAYKRAAGNTGIYPCGEGAGYAGGIASAASDGLKVAEQLILSLAAHLATSQAPAEENQQAIKALLAGSPIILPTDTVYGIGVAALHAHPGVLYAAKQRPAEKPIAWLVSGPEALDEYGTDVSPQARELVSRFWPGALTVVVRASEAVPHEWQSAQGTIALRMPANDTALALIQAVGPLATSSANTSGQPAPTAFEDIPQTVLAHAAAVVRDNAPKSAVPSTVIDCTTDTPTILRQGAIHL